MNTSDPVEVDYDCLIWMDNQTMVRPSSIADYLINSGLARMATNQDLLTEEIKNRDVIDV